MRNPLMSAFVYTFFHLITVFAENSMQGACIPFAVVDAAGDAVASADAAAVPGTVLLQACKSESVASRQVQVRYRNFMFE